MPYFSLLILHWDREAKQSIENVYNSVGDLCYTCMIWEGGGGGDKGKEKQ